MKSLINIITEQLLLEKKIGQIASRISVYYEFELARTTHANGRTTRPDLISKDYDQRPISNDEVVDFFEYVKKDIAENIAIHNIVLDESFIIRSISRELACAVVLILEKDYFKLIIKTVFRESAGLRLTPGPYQLVITTE